MMAANSTFWERRLDHARQQEEVAWARVADLEAENERLRDGIRQHMEVRGNDPDKTQADFDLWALLN